MQELLLVKVPVYGIIEWGLSLVSLRRPLKIVPKPGMR